MRTAIVVVALAVTPLTTMTACETLESTGLGSATNVISQLTGDWQLSELAGQAVSELLPAGAALPGISFGQDGSVSGSTGVNNFFGNLDLGELAKGNFNLGDLSQTRMAGSPEAMAVENQFLSLLQQVTGFDISGDTLTLLGSGARELMKFVPLT